MVDLRHHRHPLSAFCRAPSVDDDTSGTPTWNGSDQARLRHTTTTAYRCFLPDLTGFAGRSCTGPDRQRHAMHAATAMPDLGREFSPAGADCGYRAPLAPHLARLIDGTGRSAFARDDLVRDHVEVRAPYIGFLDQRVPLHARPCDERRSRARAKRACNVPRVRGDEAHA